MSVDMNIVIFGGRLTDSPTSIGDGKSGCKFDVASNRTYRDKNGEKQEETTYMHVTCWGPLAEIVLQRSRKGDAVIVEGRLEVRKFTGDDGGQKKFVNIVAKDVRFADSKKQDTIEQEERETFNSLPPGVNQQTAALLQHLLGSGK